MKILSFNLFIKIISILFIIINCNEIKDSLQSQRKLCKESSPGNKKENFEFSCGILFQIYSNPSFDSNNLSSRQENSRNLLFVNCLLDYQKLKDCDKESSYY
jgi:hypothetical protein